VEKCGFIVRNGDYVHDTIADFQSGCGAPQGVASGDKYHAPCRDGNVGDVFKCLDSIGDAVVTT
jgi:hypothetical protein